MYALKQDITRWLEGFLSGDFHVEKHAFSHQDDVYRIRCTDKSYYLKIAPSLTAEYESI